MHLIVVYLLATLPEYHRQGLGKQVMDICLQDADAAQAKTFLIATEAGSGLYRKLGFQEVDSLTFDTLPYGGDETTTWLCMMRQPKRREA
jgi:ribosomal protein S18 acetylase RimI-like enzyme